MSFQERSELPVNRFPSVRKINPFLCRLLVWLLFVTTAGSLSAYDTLKDSSGIYVVVLSPGAVPMKIKTPTPSSPLLDGSTSYATPLLAAMKLWNDQMGVVNFQGQVEPTEGYVSGNGINEIAMDSKADGEDFGENTLAITLSYRVSNVRTESDVVFNTAHTWDSYRGGLRNDREDIQRVAVHELGHILGLDHPNQATPAQAVTAVMNSTVSNIQIPVTDDINGARSLYGAPGFVPANDNFANAATLTISGSSAQAVGASIAGTAEVGEPDHDSETPTHSVWWKWTATSADPVTLTTFGSNFDTVLAVYAGSTLNDITSVVSNDDGERSVIRTSKLTFAPTIGTTYYIAVDGWDGSYGQLTLNLILGTANSSAPTITTQPTSLGVTLGNDVTCRVVTSGSPSGYQWFRNGSPISGKTTDTLELNDVSADDAGGYYVVVTNASGSTKSNTATLSILPDSLANQSVTQGYEVSFSAPTLSGSYQWQISLNGGTTWNDVPINSAYSGATSQILTVSNVGISFNGAQFRYVITSDGGTATGSAITLTVNSALIPFPVSLTVDGSGNLYVTDSSVHTVHKITTTNRVSTLAGSSGAAGASNGTSENARFNQPSGITTTAAGLLTVVDMANTLIRRVTSTGVVTTLAGSANLRGNEDGAGTAATFGMPIGIAQDSSGTFTIADATNHTLRKMTAANAVTTLAGEAGTTGSTDGSGSSARFNYPAGVATHPVGGIYISDATNNLIRKVTPAGAVTTLAGVVAVSGWQDGTGRGALFNQPGGLATDSAGNIYVADTGNSVVRKITPAGVVTTLAGLSTVGGLKDGTGSEAWFNQPRDLAVDTAGNVYVADTGNAAIRKITPAGVVTTMNLSLAASGSTGGTSSGGSSGGGTTTTTVATGIGGGGGGGGAPSLWFLGLLSALLGLRVIRIRR